MWIAVCSMSPSRSFLITGPTSRSSSTRSPIAITWLSPVCLKPTQEPRASAGLTAGLLVLPRFTRWVSAVLAIFFGSDVLQIAYKKAEDTL